MAFFTQNRDPEQVKDRSGGSFISKSGMYPVKILNAIVNTKDTGTTFIDLYIEYNGQPQMLYSVWCLNKKDGSPNEIGLDGFNKFCIVTNAPQNISDPIPMELPIGKNNEMKECQVLAEFTDSVLTMLIKMEYSLYEGKISEKKIVRNMFQAGSNFTASEVVNKATEAKQYAKELTNAEIAIYKDGLTEEVVNQWIADGRNNDGPVKPATAPAPKTGFTPRKRFGN